MRLFADNHRFEDAAAVRDRWLALDRSLNERRAWTALQDAELIKARDRSGTNVLINRGVLEMCTVRGKQDPLPPAPREWTEHATSMADLDEAMLIWRWLTSGDTSLVHVSGTFATSSVRVADIRDVYATDDPGVTDESGRSNTTPASVTMPRTRTSERKPPTRMGSKPFTTTTWVPTRS
jgi:hypothetical protein